MFVAASTRCLGPVSLFDACSQLTDLEFDKVELWLTTAVDELNPAVIAADPERFQASFREATRLTPVAVDLQEDPDPDVFLNVSRLCKLMRIAQISIPASPLGTPFNTEIDRLRQFVQVAGAEGVRLSIRTEAGHTTADPHTAVELCESVKGLGLTLDPSHYLQLSGDDPIFDRLYPHVFHTHLRDSTPTEYQVTVGLGEVDYSRLVNQLSREKYNRALSIEILPEEGTPDQRQLELRQLELRKLRMLLETLL
ncbi:MAG: sugar phosphate isomerase/epimerase [Planctomycetaceae bacterium]|nr:sugar phosphate isomerase/epimerase [Planctomycetaceae bacterium]